MPTVNPTLPADDTTADVADYNVPIQAILAVFNGHIDGDNIEPGSLPWSVMDSFTNEIPAAAMEHSGNLEKYRDELVFGIVTSGLVWSDVSGLDGAMTAGVGYTKNGLRHEVSAVTSHTFTASKDTYVELLSNGNIDYQEVANGAVPPTLGTDSIRLARVVTDGTEITGVTDLRVTPTSPKSAAGNFSATAGDHIISGLPFKPSIVKVRFWPAAGTNDRFYWGEGIADRVNNVQRSASFATNSGSARRDRSSTKVVQVTNDHASTVIIEGTVSAWGDDYFTINLTVAASSSDNIEWEAYP